MNFYQAPIARFIYTAVRNTDTVARPVVPDTGVYNDTALGTHQALGRNVTVFFETPGWPTASHKIEVRGQVAGTTVTNGNLVAAPNVCLSDADSYIFLRGNSVFANNATPANGIHVVYSATLDNVQLASGSSRASDGNNYWVRPGDTFTFTNPVQAATVGSNIGDDGNGRNQVATVTSVRQKGGPDRLVIEFSVPIVTTAVAGYRTGAEAWALRDLVFFQGATPGAAVNPVGLSFNRPTVRASSSGGGWSGVLSGVVNLTYPTANPVAVYVPGPGVTAPAAGGLINSSNMLIASAASLAATGRQMFVQLDGGTAPTRYNCNYTFEHRPDFSQGSVPYRCISFAASANWAIELLVHPLH